MIVASEERHAMPVPFKIDPYFPRIVRMHQSIDLGQGCTAEKGFLAEEPCCRV